MRKVFGKPGFRPKSKKKIKDKKFFLQNSKNHLLTFLENFKLVLSIRIQPTSYNIKQR